MKVKLKKIRTEIVPAKFYNCCDDLPLYNFVKLVCSEIPDLKKWLVISGLPKESVLTKAWESISEEYNDISKDITNTYLLDLLINISSLELRLRLVYDIVEYLGEHRSEELIEVLQNDMGFNYEYSEETIIQDLKSTISEVKLDKVNFDLSKKELKDYTDKHKAPTESDYDSILSILSKHQGYQIRKKETSVSEYVAILNAFKEANKPSTNRIIEE